MKAARYHEYGSGEVIHIEEVEKPALTDDGVMVRVRASSVNPADWHYLTGTPLIARPTFGLTRPKDERLGTDFAGTVEAVGGSVTEFQPGDEVFGGGAGAMAEYMSVRADKAVVKKPTNVTFEEAGTVAIAGCTALQAVRDHGKVQAGQRVLVNGASGGVGTFAVQIAKAYGAVVTGVCSTGNVELVRSLGADRVIDYTKEDFTRGAERYDLILDVAGSRRWSELRRVLNPTSTEVVVGAPKGGAWLGPVSQLIKLRVGSIRAPQKLINFLAKLTKKDMVELAALIEAGKLRPAIERTYPLKDVGAAFDYVIAGHAKAKVVVTI